MRILMTTDTLGGVWTYALELARALEPFDVDIVLAALGRPLSDTQRGEACRLKHMQVHEGPFTLEWMRNPWRDVAAAGNWLSELAETYRPDLVHLNDYSHGNRDWGTPVLMVGHSCVCSWYEHVRGVHPGVDWDEYCRRVRSGLQAAHLVIAPTRAMLSQLQRHYGPLCSTRVISNARGLPRLPSVKREAFVLAAGRVWDEGKNIALLASIAERVPWPIHVAGEQTHPEGRGTATHNGLVCLGALPQQAMPELYARASLYALPARYEPFGFTPLEAALCGCPLVLGDIDTLREVWDDAAVFVDPTSRRAWKKTLKQLISDSSRRRDYASRARRRAGQYCLREMGEAYFSSYRTLIDTFRAEPSRRESSGIETSPTRIPASSMPVEGVA